MKNLSLLVFAFPCVLFSCKTNQSENKVKAPLDQNLSSIKIPKKSNENEFKDLKILYWGYDYFEENLFDSIQKKSIKKEGFQTEIIGNIYPYAWIDQGTYPVYFYLKTQKEAGLIEPIIMAYIVDKQKDKILDSLEVHKHFEWEGSYHKYFEITKDSILIVYEKESFDPNFGENADSISTGNFINTNKVTKYSIQTSFQKIP